MLFRGPKLIKLDVTNTRRTLGTRSISKSQMFSSGW